MEDVKEILKNVWPEWEIGEKIGEGSFGSVYKAERKDIVGSSSAAIKITQIPQDCNEIEALHAEGLSHDQEQAYYEDIIRNYSAEIKLMMDVRGYTNIVAIDDYKVWQPPDRMVWYFVIRMELLTPLVKRTALGAMDEDEIIKLGIDLCTALDVCRRSSIIHRDIKPENIFFNSNGDYKLGDFGVARSLEKISGGLSCKGTPNYMAPEIYKSTLNEIDFEAASRVDLYSLGMVLYWLSNRSKLPFIPLDKQIASPDDRKNAFLRRINGDPLPPPVQASPGLQAIILKACSYRSEDRYKSAAAMRAALLALQYKKAHPEPQKKAPPAPAKPTKANPAQPNRPVMVGQTIKVYKQQPPAKSPAQNRSQAGKPSPDKPGNTGNRKPQPRSRRKARIRRRIIALTALLAALLAALAIWYGITDTEQPPAVTTSPPEPTATETEPVQDSPTDTPGPSPVSAVFWLCSDCGKDNTYDNQYCVHCGKTRLCIECGNSVPKKTAVCPHCGMEPGHWKCSVCGTVCAYERLSCTSCGTERHLPGAP